MMLVVGFVAGFWAIGFVRRYLQDRADHREMKAIYSAPDLEMTGPELTDDEFDYLGYVESDLRPARLWDLRP